LTPVEFEEIETEAGSILSIHASLVIAYTGEPAAKNKK
jgi:hypothetical protein